MATDKKNEFRDPVFVRDDDTTYIKASVVIWNSELGGRSIRLQGSNESVLINAEDWPTLVSCINRELDRTSE